MTRMFVPTSALTLPLVLITAASAGTVNDSYSVDFDSNPAPGLYGGSAAVLTSNGQTRLALTRWGSQGTWGTWDSGDLSLGAGGSITSFNATFNFGFNDNDFSTRADQFSFSVGDLDVTFSMVSNPGVAAIWEGSQVAYQAHGTNFLDGAFSINNGSTNWLVGGNADISWTQGGDLVVKLQVPGSSTATYLTTSAVGSISLGDDTTFGFGAWQGAHTSDVWVDNLNVNFAYSTPSSVPGPAGMAALIAGLAATRRRRR